MNKSMLLTVSLCFANTFVCATEETNDVTAVLRAVRSNCEQGLYACQLQKFNTSECEKYVFKFGTREQTPDEMRLGLRVLKQIYQGHCSTPEAKKTDDCALVRGMHQILRKKYQSTQS